MEQENAVDWQLMMTYVDTYPRDKSFEELPHSPLAALETARPKEEALFDMNSSDKELYYSFLADVVKQQPMNLENELEVFARQKDVALSMWKSEMDYFRIIRCLTYMPVNTGTSDRYTKAVFFTAAAVNPILTMPEISQAKPINQLDSRSSDHDIYHAYLKAVLMRNPSQRLREADKEVVKLLHHIQMPEDSIRQCLQEYSLEFLMPEKTGDAVTDYQAQLAVISRIKALIQEAYQEIDPQRPMSLLDIQPSDDDAVIYQKMQETIRSMKEQHESGDSFQYWETSIHIMQEALNRFNAFQNLSKTVSILMVGAERAAKECEVSLPQELKHIQEQLGTLSQQTERRRQDWTALRETADSAVRIASQLVDELRKKREQNPLFQLVEVQHAKPLPEVLNAGTINPQDLYFSFLRQVARSHPKILPDQADLIVARKFQEHKIPAYIQLRAMSASPCFRQIDASQQLTAVRSFLDAAIQKPGKEEGRQR